MFSLCCICEYSCCGCVSLLQIKRVFLGYGSDCLVFSLFTTFCLCSVRSVSTLIVCPPISCTLSLSVWPFVHQVCQFVEQVVSGVPCVCHCLVHNLFFVVLFCFVFVSIVCRLWVAFCWTVLSVAPACSACCPCLQVQTLFSNLDCDNLHPPCSSSNLSDSDTNGFTLQAH